MATQPEIHSIYTFRRAIQGQADIPSNFLACIDLILELYQNKANGLNAKSDHNFNTYIRTFLAIEIQRFRTLPPP